VLPRPGHAVLGDVVLRRACAAQEAWGACGCSRALTSQFSWQCRGGTACTACVALEHTGFSDTTMYKCLSTVTEHICLATSHALHSHSKCIP
jgi:hypothetical protein